MNRKEFDYNTFKHLVTVYLPLSLRRQRGNSWSKSPSENFFNYSDPDLTALSGEVFCLVKSGADSTSTRRMTIREERTSAAVLQGPRKVDS